MVLDYLYYDLDCYSTEDLVDTLEAAYKRLYENPLDVRNFKKIQLLEKYLGVYPK